MTAADFTYYEKLTNRHDYTVGEQEQLEALLDEAEQAILAETNNEWEATSGSDIPAKNLQVRIVQRYFENPLGITAEGADGFSYSRNVAANGIELLESEIRQLIKYGIKKTSRQFGTLTFTHGGSVW